MQACSEVITEHSTPLGAKPIVCYSMLDCLCQQQRGVQAPSSGYRWVELLQKMGVLIVHPVQWLHLPWRIFFQMETQLGGPK